MCRHRQKMTIEEANQRRKLDRERRRLARESKKRDRYRAFELDGEGPSDVDLFNFDTYMSTLVWFCCSICKKKQMVPAHAKKPCKNCKLFSDENDMDPGDVPEVLQGLSFVEQQLIAMIHPVVSLYKIMNVQYKYTGNIINFPQNVQEVATSLPYKVADIKGLLTVRAVGSEGYKDFRVRKKRVHEALLWLKKNNTFYTDIVINEANLSELPEDGDVYKQTRGYDVLVKDSNEPCCSKGLEGVHFIESNEMYDEDGELYPVIHKDVPNISMVTQHEKITNCVNENILLWPSVGRVPVNEFSSPGYISMAFPCLFPYGKCDYSTRHDKRVSLSKYVEHLMLYEDGRFAKDPRFRFFILNSMMRWEALTLGNVFVKKNEFFSKMTVLQLKDYLKHNPRIVNEILFYSSRLRSTKSYWKSRSSELQDMVEQLGPPTIFFTLSSADYHWQDLYRLLGYDDPNSLSFEVKSRLLADNPLIVSCFFNMRVEYFMDKCFRNHFNVKDMWYRVEFQHRGSCHVHGVVWLDGAPDIKNIVTDEDKKTAAEFFDKLISCKNPNVNVLPNLVHPCSQRGSEVTDVDDDLAQLVNRVQRHTKCSTSYCMKSKGGKKANSCRFGFPKKCCDETKIIESDDGTLDIEFERNDELVNKHNKWLVRSWRANVDFSPILSERVLCKYIAKYASKCEYKSEIYAQIVANVMNSSVPENEHCKKVIRGLMIGTCAERDYCAQEVMYLLMGYHLYHSSRAFVVLNIRRQAWNVISMSRETQHKSLFDRYSTRPKYLTVRGQKTLVEDMSICNFYKHFYFSKNKWVSRRRDAVVRCFPRASYVMTNDFDDLRNECILYVPW